MLKSIGILALLLGSLAVSPAAVINFQINFQDIILAGSEKDIPIFSVKNRSEVAKITKLEIGIGLTSKNFDRVGGFSAALTGATRVSPDLINAGVRSDVVVFKFSNFDPGESFGFFTEIDDDLAISSSENYRHILLDNGPGPNGYATATFSDMRGVHRQTIVFQDTTRPMLLFSLVAVPEPGTLTMFALGLAGLGFRRRRT